MHDAQCTNSVGTHYRVYYWGVIMSGLVQVYGEEDRYLVNYGLSCLKNNGITAQWYVDNFAHQLKRLKLEIDMGLQVKNIRSALPFEHPLLPVAELFMEMQLLAPYTPEVCGIPVTLPPEFVGFACSHLVNHFENGDELGNGDFTIYDLAISSEEFSLAAYKSGLPYLLKSITSASYEDIMHIAVSNPAAILYFDRNLISSDHWKNAMIADFRNIIDAVPADAIIAEIFMSKIQTINNGLSCYLSGGKRSLTEIIGLDRNKMLEICKCSLHEIKDVVDYFTEDELIQIIKANPKSIGRGEIIGHGERLDLVAVELSFYSENHEKVVQKLSNEVIIKAIDLDIVNFKLIEKDSARFFSGKAALAVRKKAKMIITADSDIPF
jgi:hypothetical protein